MPIPEPQPSGAKETSPEPVQNVKPPFVFIVVMGVSGTGKSTLGSALARTLDVPYVEGDDLHPRANVDKMASGQPLDDTDREPWLELIRTIAEHKAVELQAQVLNESEEEANGTEGEKGARKRKKVYGVVITCSALKRYYRDILRGTRKPGSKESGRVPQHLEPPPPSVLPTYFVFIRGERELLFERMKKRAGHYMKASMLDSQLSTLEDPSEEKGVVQVEATDRTERQVEVALEGLTRIAGPYFKD